MGITASDLKQLRTIRKRMDAFTAQEYVQLLLNTDMAIAILQNYAGFSPRTDRAIELLKEAKAALQPEDEYWDTESIAFKLGEEGIYIVQQVCTGAVGAALFGFGDSGFMDE